ncbi:MAG: hypothetical protein H6Q15_479 [Bacteroidetes bacterium]|nr:hypothetical protein [Bacteroidota bacterium]
MKKIYLTPEYKAKHKRKIKLSLRKLEELNCEIKKNNINTNIATPVIHVKRNRYTIRFRRLGNRKVRDLIAAPIDFRFLDNTDGTIRFFDQLMDCQNYHYSRGIKKVKMTLSNVLKIDYATISLLISISRNLKSRGIYLFGDFPKEEKSRKALIDSGFFEYMRKSNGEKFQFNTKSRLMFLSKGKKRFLESEDKKMSDELKDVNYHLTGNKTFLKDVRLVILEMCANSLEWSDSHDRQWLLGVSLCDGKAVFTLVDLGKGILNDLNRKYKDKFSDKINLRNDAEILMRAFDKKYQSQSEEINRNKGLPSIKGAVLNNNIGSLIVATNNVILQINKDETKNVSKILNKEFKGTFYQWELTKNNNL